MEVKVIIEMGKDGTFSAYTTDLEGMIIVGDADTIEGAKADFYQGLAEYIELYTEQGDTERVEQAKALSFVFSLDLVSFLKYQKILNISEIARMFGINPSLMRQYKAGQYMSEARAQEIVQGLNAIGRELTAIRL